MTSDAQKTLDDLRALQADPMGATEAELLDAALDCVAELERERAQWDDERLALKSRAATEIANAKRAQRDLATAVGLLREVVPTLHGAGVIGDRVRRFIKAHDDAPTPPATGGDQRED